MTINPKGNTEDTATVAPQNDRGGDPEVEFVDTPDVAPKEEERGQETHPESQMYFGKYKSMEEAEKAFAEAQRGFHAAKEEASAYRKAIESMQTQHPQGHANAPPAGMGNMDEINEKFRGQLEQDTWGTLTAFAKHIFNQERQAETQRQGAMLGEFKKYASDPEFAVVAGEVMQQLAYEQNPNVESAFLRAKLMRLQRGQAVQSAQSDDNARRNFVEPARGTKSESEVLRIELDNESKRVRNAFRMSDEQFRELAKNTAYAKMENQVGRVPVSIDEYRSRRGGMR